MNALETNAGNAVVRYLTQGNILGPIPPRLWDSDEDATIPRLSIKCSQGQELVYRYGVYRITCEIRMVAEVTNNRIDEMTREVRSLLLDDFLSHKKLGDGHFFCFAIESVSSGVTTIAGKKRTRTMVVSLVGFDLDRFNT